MSEDLRSRAMEYHREPTPGKIEVVPTKPLSNQRDLALAYSPGVAAACEAIVDDPNEARNLTARGNLVAVITNGTAVLGLGAIGPLAAKPVMEGKGVLFKKFAGIDVFDIEVSETDPDRFVDVVAALEPTFGAINLEDIKAPECFFIERQLRERLKIPVFHDDQHGTAIIVAAAVLNGLQVVGKPLESVRLVASGAGAAAIACLELLVSLGLPLQNILVCDRKGVIHSDRGDPLDASKMRFAHDTGRRTLAEAMAGADVFLGLSGPGLVDDAMVASLAPRPLILALANPTPEVLPEAVTRVRDDAVICTGRSDYPNQVNNVLCFPFIFRGALDVGATTINREMEIAAVYAIAELAQAESADDAARAYGGQTLHFGPEYVIPRPFDPRLISAVAPAVARAAMLSGVATRPIDDFDAYRRKLKQFVYKSGQLMRPLFEQAKSQSMRVSYAEGEDERVLRAVQEVVDEGLAQPILIGRPEVIGMRIERLGLRIRAGRDFEVVNLQSDPRFRDYWTHYHGLMERRGVTPQIARMVVTTRATAIAALALVRDDTDAMLCGLSGRFLSHLRHIVEIVGLQECVRQPAAMTALILSKGTFFITDTNVSPAPKAEELAQIAVLAAREVRHFGFEPKVALISHSNFGSMHTRSARTMRKALARIREMAPELLVEGEMHADAALSEEVRLRVFPNSMYKGAANLLVMPSLDTANTAFNMLKMLGDGVSVGPVLLGVRKPAHVLTSSASVRTIVNMTAVAAVDVLKSRSAEYADNLCLTARSA
ncbi:MAG TPA: NADP-dependent malic enzyme [Gammaproteobacteria bacterium]